MDNNEFTNFFYDHDFYIVDYILFQIRFNKYIIIEIFTFYNNSRLYFNIDYIAS